MKSDKKKLTVLPENEKTEETAAVDTTPVEDTAVIDIEPADEIPAEAVEAVAETAEAVEETVEAVEEPAEVTEESAGEAEPTDEVVEAADNEDSPAPTDGDPEDCEDSPALTEDIEVEDGEDEDETEDEADSEPEEPEDSVDAEDVHADKSEVAPAVAHAAHEKKKKPKKEDGTRRVDALFDFIELFVFTLAAVLFITSFFIRHSVVDGDSMLGTLHDGENLLISDLFYEPERGDIIVVDDHSTLLKKPIIKRVIAVEGDVVRITKYGVLVNGEPLVEDYVFTDNSDYLYEVYPSAALMTNETLVIKAGEYYELTVPEGELFVMGDHRNKSTDSRQIGTVDEDAVLGKVILRFYPFDKFGEIE